MSTVNLFKEIIQHGPDNEISALVNPPATPKNIAKLETLLGETLPEEVKQLYLFADGQRSDVEGIFFGDEFMTTQQVIAQLQFSKSLKKGENSGQSFPESSETVLQKIADIFLEKAEQFADGKSWHRLQFDYGVGSLTGPFLYENEKTPDHKRDILEIEFEDLEEADELLEKMHSDEKNVLNWDEIKFTVFPNGEFKAERTSYDFDNEIPFTSTPPNTVKKIYFHDKWLPIFTDGGGNFIGVDLDPDTEATNGQVIIFGRDEDDLYALAENLERFFETLKSKNKSLAKAVHQQQSHLHDILKENVSNKKG